MFFSLLTPQRVFLLVVDLYSYFIVYIYILCVGIYTMLTKVLAPLLMKGLTTLVMSLSTNLNV